jgi:hypothetical protein
LAALEAAQPTAAPALSATTTPIETTAPVKTDQV